jgi:hypothetical protein
LIKSSVEYGSSFMMISIVTLSSAAVNVVGRAGGGAGIAGGAIGVGAVAGGTICTGGAGLAADKHAVIGIARATHKARNSIFFMIIFLSDFNL